MIRNYLVLETVIGNIYFSILDFSSKISFYIDGKEIVSINKDKLIIDKENSWKKVVSFLKLEERPEISLITCYSSLFFLVFTKNYAYISFFLYEETYDLLIFKIKLDENNIFDVLFFLKDFFELEDLDSKKIPSKKLKKYFESIFYLLQNISITMKAF